MKDEAKFDLVSDHETKAALTDLPPFADESEIEREYRRYLDSVTELQVHGIRTGEGPGEVLVMIERPGEAHRDSSLNWDWGCDSAGTLHLARYILRVALHERPDEEIVRTFADKIVSRLSRHEWTLTYDFIRQWYRLIKENS